MRKFKRSLSLRERVRVRESRRLATGGLLLSLAFSLAGCWKVGPDYVKPQVDTPKQWRFADKAARDTTNLKWWKLLGDPMLDKLVNRAILGNLDLKIAVARVDEFMGLYGTTRSNLFPQVSGFAEYHRQVLPVLGERNVTRLGGQLSWELDVWGALRRANEAAFADLLGQEAFQRAVILTLASDVAQTYIQLRTLDKNLEITRRMVGTLEEQLSIETIRFKEGFGSDLEVSQIRSEYERRQALIPVAEQAIAQTEHALKVLLGQNPGPIPRGKSLDELKLPAVPAGLPSDLLVRRPDIRIAEQTLIAANARIGVARGLYFPKVLITGDLGQLASQTGELFTPGRNFWSIGSNILGPIFTAGKIAGQVQATEAVQRQAVANYQQTIISAFREFEDALVATQKTKEQRRKQAERVAAVENYYRLSKLRYDEGLVDYITVLDSLRQLYEAQIDLLQAHSATYTASIQLYRAMGGGWIVAAEEDAQLPKPREASVFP